MSNGRPPGPQGTIGFGNGRAYERDRIGYLQSCQQEYGDVFRFSDVSSVVLDPQLIQQLHARTNAEFVTEAPTFAGKKHNEWLVGTISTTMANRRSEWRGIKGSEASKRTDGIINAFDHVMASTCNREVNVHDVMMRVSGYAVADFCLGGDGQDLSEVVDAIDNGVRATMALTNRPQRYPVWFPLPRVLRMVRTRLRAREILEAAVAKRLSNPSTHGPRDLLDTLLDTPEPDIANIAMIINLTLRASYAIPGAAMTWAIRQFALQPELVHSLRSESQAISDASCPQRPLAEAVVKEVLRMYPPSWLGGREVRTSTTLGEWNFSAGEQVMFSPYIVHRDPRYWEHDPQSFQPERWMAANPPHARHAYIPFGAGPRICIGNQLGMLELILVISRLATDYEIVVTNVDSAPTAPGAVLVPRNLKARFVRRQPA